MPLYLILGLSVISSYLWSTVMFDAYWEEWKGEERDTDKPPMFWWFNGICLFATLQLGMVNGLFLWFSYWDAKRRIWLMR